MSRKSERDSALFQIALKLRVYARHQADCAELLTGEPCDCGWTELRTELDKPCEEKTDVRDEHTETA